MRSITTEAQRRTEGAEILQIFDSVQSAFDSSTSSVFLCASVVIVLLVSSTSIMALRHSHASNDIHVMALDEGPQAPRSSCRPSAQVPRYARDDTPRALNSSWLEGYPVSWSWSAPRARPPARTVRSSLRLRRMAAVADRRRRIARVSPVSCRAARSQLAARSGNRAAPARRCNRRGSQTLLQSQHA